MPYSTLTALVDSSGTINLGSMEYLSPSHLTFKTAAGATVVATQLEYGRFSVPTLHAGTSLDVFRETPDDELSVNLVDLSTFTAAQLQANALQTLFILQETKEALEDTPATVGALTDSVDLLIGQVGTLQTAASGLASNAASMQAQITGLLAADVSLDSRLDTAETTLSGINLSLYYTRTQIDDMLVSIGSGGSVSLANYYTIAQTNTAIEALGTTINIGAYYTASQIDTNHYTKSAVYTKSEVDDLVDAVPLLPTVDATNNGSTLSVVAGAWAARTPANVRSDLGLGSSAVKAAGTGTDNVLLLATASTLPALDASALLNVPLGKLIILKDLKSPTVVGGTATSGSWITRVVNTKELDETAGVTIASNQITLPAGTYRFRIECPAYDVGYHRARLVDNTSGTPTVLREGSSAYASSGNAGYSTSVIVGKITVAASRLLEIQHRVGSTKASTGFGQPNGWGTNEVYTIAEFLKVS